MDLRPGRRGPSPEAAAVRNGVLAGSGSAATLSTFHRDLGCLRVHPPPRAPPWRCSCWGARCQDDNDTELAGNPSARHIRLCSGERKATAGVVAVPGDGGMHSRQAYGLGSRDGSGCIVRQRGRSPRESMSLRPHTRSASCAAAQRGAGLRALSCSACTAEGRRSSQRSEAAPPFRCRRRGLRASGGTAPTSWRWPMELRRPRVAALELAGGPRAARHPRGIGNRLQAVRA